MAVRKILMLKKEGKIWTFLLENDVIAEIHCSLPDSDQHRQPVLGDIYRRLRRSLPIKSGKNRFVSETSWSFRSAGKQSRQKRRLSAAISILPGGMQYWQPEIPGSVLPGSFPVLFGIRTKKNWVISKMRTTGWSFVRMQRTFPLRRYLRRFRNWRMPVSS